MEKLEIIRAKLTTSGRETMDLNPQGNRTFKSERNYQPGVVEVNGIPVFKLLVEK